MIWAALKSPVTRYALGAALIIAGLVVSWHGGRWSQRADYRAAVAEARIEHKEKADAIEDAIKDMDHGAYVDDLYDRLLGHD